MISIADYCAKLQVWLNGIKGTNYGRTLLSHLGTGASVALVMIWARKFGGKGGKAILMRRSLVPLLAVSLLTGCNDPKATNEANFTKALNDYLKHSPHTCVPLPDRARRESSASNPVFIVADDNGPYLRKMTALNFAGLANAPESKKQYGRPLKTFSLTPAGLKAYRGFSTEDGRKAYRGSNAIYLGFDQICFAEAVVASIEKYSEPAGFMGAIVSEVTYTYKFQNISPWASKSEIEAVFPEIKRVLEQQGKPIKRVLSLTNKGWSWD